MNGKRGTTLINLMIGLTITGVVMTGAVGVLVRHRHLYTKIQDTALSVGALNHLEAALAAELLPLNPSAGDLIHAEWDSLVTRSFLGVFSVCSRVESPISFTVRQISRGDALSEGDSALIYSQGDSAKIDDDHWRAIGMNSISATTCPDGEQGRSFNVEGLTTTGVGQVPPGAPMRAFVRTIYSFVERTNGWYIVRRNGSQPAYSIGGPFLPPSQNGTGLRFRYLDAAGQPTSVESEVARIEVVATAAKSVSGSRGDPVNVSRTLAFTFRNN